MKRTSIEELKAIVERLESVILNNKDNRPFILGFTEAIRDRLNDVIKDEEDILE